MKKHSLFAICSLMLTCNAIPVVVGIVDLGTISVFKKTQQAIRDHSKNGEGSNLLQKSTNHFCLKTSSSKKKKVVKKTNRR